MVSKEAVAPSMASMAEWVAGVWAVERAARFLRLGRRAANSPSPAWLAVAGRVTAGVPGTVMAGDCGRKRDNC